jgi:CubicO group peptidase (beta-lactamase class C family)
MSKKREKNLLELQGYLDKLTAEDAFSGCVLFAHKGIPIFNYVCGFASKSFNIPNQINTKFNLGSLNKMFTGMAVCQLAERGKLDFNDCVGQHLPDYPNPTVAERVTIHQLLTHTSGMGSFWNERFKSTSKECFKQVQDFFPLFINDPLAFEPGEAYQYSNAGYVVLGAIIESITGQNYFDFVREHIYEPAQMKNTDAYEMDYDTPNLATGYTKEGNQNRLHNNLYLHVVKGGPSGGGFSTVEDLLGFDIAIRTGRLLNPHYTTLLLSGKVKTDMPGVYYAYGFFERRLNGLHSVGHGGGFSGISSTLRMYPESGYTVVAMSNYDPPVASQVADWIEEHMLRALN